MSFAFAHSGVPDGQSNMLSGTIEPWLVACLATAAALYAAGAWKLWRKAGFGRGLTLGQAASFAGGWLTLVLALVSPLDALGGRLFSAHMVQHELLMIVAAPLFVMSRPLETWTWGLPSAWRGGAARIAHWTALHGAWRALTAPACAWASHAAALWVWHMPACFDAALRSETMHAWQHASFLATALLFWWAALGRAGARHPGSAITLLFTTMLHTGALGALLTFSPSPWYRAYGDSAAFGIAPLEDQQLGGLIMWIPGGGVYLAFGLAIVFRHYLSPAPGDGPTRPNLPVDQVPRP